MSERRKIYLQLLTCTLAFLQVIVQAQAQSVSIKAFLPYWHNAVVQLTIDGKRVHIDSFHNDVYSYTGKIEGTKQGTFEIKRKNITTFLSLFIEPGVIKIRDEGQRLVAYGTPLNDAFSIKPFD